MINDSIKRCLISEDIKVTEAMQLLSTLDTKVLFVHDNYKLLAAISDGDIRRYILSSGNLDSSIKNVANYNPKYLINASHNEAEQFMRDFSIDAVPIVNEELIIQNIIFVTIHLFRLN